MGAISSALGLGSQLDYKGKTYQLAPWTYKIQGLYETYLQEEALRTMRKMRPYCTEEEYRDLMIATRRDIDTGFYSFGQDSVQRTLSSMPHLEYLLYLMLQANHPDMTRELVREIMQEKMDEVMQKMNEANADPNPKREEQPAAASPSP